MGRRKAKTALITFILTFLIVGILAFFLCSSMLKTKDEEIERLTELQADAECYAFASDLRAGAIITQGDLKLIEFKSVSKTSGMYMRGSSSSSALRYLVAKDEVGNEITSETQVLLTDELIGRRVKTNVSANMPVLEALLYTKDGPDAKDVRIEELSSSYLELPTNLMLGDYFDVRIQFPDGSDYVVLAGKCVEATSVDDLGVPTADSVYTKISEEELMLLGSAIVEAYMEKGTRLYATKFIDPSTQLFKEEIIDYVAKYERGLQAAMIAKEYDLMVAQAGGPSGELFTLTYDEYAALTSEERDTYKRRFNVPSVKESEITNAEIAAKAGIEEDYARAIREAKESNDEKAKDTLNYFRIMKVKTKTPLAKTYAVRDAVLEVVRNNPNLVNTIKAEFNTREVTFARIDKYKELQAEYEVAPDYPTYGDSSTKTKAQIKQEMDELVKERTENVAAGIEQEVQAEKARRVNYLQALIDGSI